MLAGIPDPGEQPRRLAGPCAGRLLALEFRDRQLNPFGEDGALMGFADRVHGPSGQSTFSTYDWAVGVRHARASFLTREDQQAETPKSRWGGMGSDGFQGVTPFRDLTMPADGTATYDLTPGTFHRVDSQAVIDDIQNQFAGAHSDITKPPVAELIAQAAAAHT